jgi:hypothetical protein
MSHRDSEDLLGTADPVMVNLERCLEFQRYSDHLPYYVKTGESEAQASVT